MADSGGAKVRTVADVMSHPPVTATPSETIAEATSRMREHRVGSVVVVDGERAIGILTERDLVRFAASGADTSATKVSEWMTEDPDCVAPDIEVTEAWKSLAEHGYRHIPVVDGQRLVGIVSMRDLVKIAQIRPVEGAIADVPKGLAGVVVAETEVGDVRGQEGFYHYRQYNAVELADKRSLEDVWFLLFEGHLPSKAEHDAFVAEMRGVREIPAPVMEVLPAIAQAGETFVPLDGLRTAVSLLGMAENYKFSLDIDHTELRANAMQVCAVIPTLIMALYRLREG
ncbi:MAG: CBS domain-containing protein, partial [Actinobacteria bacterium]|nr:CBS domain-containing protein [Actinomycetota bacterium]